MMPNSLLELGVTRRHWMPAVALKSCSNPKCGTVFPNQRRKHHCRCCGNVFCANCTSQSLPLDPSTAQPLSGGIWAKVCLLCFEKASEEGFGSAEAFESWDPAEGQVAPYDSLEEHIFGSRRDLKPKQVTVPTPSPRTVPVPQNGVWAGPPVGPPGSTRTPVRAPYRHVQVRFSTGGLESSRKLPGAFGGLYRAGSLPTNVKKDKNVPRADEAPVAIGSKEETSKVAVVDPTQRSTSQLRELRRLWEERVRREQAGDPRPPPVAEASATGAAGRTNHVPPSHMRFRVARLGIQGLHTRSDGTPRTFSTSPSPRSFQEASSPLADPGAAWEGVEEEERKVEEGGEEKGGVGEGNGEEGIEGKGEGAGKEDGEGGEEGRVDGETSGLQGGEQGGEVGEDCAPLHVTVGHVRTLATVKSVPLEVSDFFSMDEEERREEAGGDGFPEDSLEKGREQRGSEMSTWTVENVCDWLREEVGFPEEGSAESHSNAFLSHGVSGPQLLAIRRGDPPCADMAENDWLAFKNARWQHVTGLLNPATPEKGRTVVIPMMEEESDSESSGSPDSPPTMDSPLWELESPNPASPRSPTLSDSLNDKNTFAASPLNAAEASLMSNASWLWNIVKPSKVDEASAAVMEVHSLRREILAAEERQSTLKAQLNHVDDVMRNAQMAEYLFTRTVWTPSPGGVPPVESPASDWLPKFVTLCGHTLAVYSKATDVTPQETINLQAVHEVGMHCGDQGFEDGAEQWNSFFVLSEHGMLECRMQSREKCELWAFFISEAFPQ